MYVMRPFQRKNVQLLNIGFCDLTGHFERHEEAEKALPKILLIYCLVVQVY